MKITLNGAVAEVTTGATVQELLVSRGIRPERVLVEINRSIVPAAEWHGRALAENDEVEVLSFVGGG
jgi:sulfur carrier protein